MRICRKCQVPKDEEEFPSRGGNRRRPDCKDCHYAVRRDRHDPERHRAAMLRSVYGITIEEYKELEVTQGGRCAICQEVPEGRLYVDHDHATGIVRGLLCNNCNFGLGHFKDNPDFLRAAIDYLLGP